MNIWYVDIGNTFYDIVDIVNVNIGNTICRLAETREFSVFTDHPKLA